MRTMLRVSALAAVVVVVGLGSVERRGWAQDPEDETAREIMWRKLDLSHNVLDALALDDFEALEAYAEDLEDLGTAGFMFILDTDEYRRSAEEFRNAARSLKRAARENNSQAGALAYMDLTLRCIRCHQSLEVVPR